MLRVEFGPTALEYVRKQLESGGSLAHELLRLDLLNGRTWAFVREGADTSSLGRFEESIAADGREAELELADFVLQHLSTDDRSCAMFEDPFAREGDPVLLRTEQVPYLIYGGEVLDFLQGPNHTQDDVQRLIWASRAYRMVGILSYSDPLVPRAAITPTVLGALIQSANHVVVGAWDSEGQLIWSRNQ